MKNLFYQLLMKGQAMKTTKKTQRIQWVIQKFSLSTILYYARKKDWLFVLKAKAPGAFMARWYSGQGWGFIGYGI